MADDSTKRGARDRAQVAGGEPYELDYFAHKHGISRGEAQALIDRIGNDREKLDAAAAKRSSAAKSNSPADTKANRKGASRKAGGTTAARTPATRSRGAATAKDSANASAVSRRALSKARSGAKGRLRAAAEGVRSGATGRTATLVGAAAAGLAAGLAVNLGRKAAVQAPSAFAGDWFDAVKLEHRLALALFDKIQATGDSETRKRSVLLTQLKHALGKHAFMEENVLYPALRDWGDKADADKLNHEHGYVKQYLYDLEGLPNDSPAFLNMVAGFRADIEAHIAEEENAIFPPLHAALGAKRNAEVTARANKEGFKIA